MRSALLVACIACLLSAGQADGGEIPPTAGPDAAPEADRPAAGESPATGFSPAIPLGDWGDFRPGAVLQIWWLLYEGSENGRQQAGSGDPAVQQASGFLLRQARLSAEFEAGRFRTRLELRLESSPALLDAWLGVALVPDHLEIRLGQMKVPSVYEALTPDTATDFATRSLLAEQMPNWALATHSAITSPLQGLRSMSRDLGLGLKGSGWGFDGFLMVGNGLGANQFVGASTGKGYLQANRPGAWLYAARLSFDAAGPFDETLGRALVTRLAVGGHVSWNDHPNALLLDGRTVIDIRRLSWSADLQIEIARRFRLTGMYGAGMIGDDFDNDGTTDYRYRGWEAKLVAGLLPGTLEAALRIDEYRHEYSENGHPETRRAYTAGLSWRPLRHLLLRLDFRHQTFRSDTDPDLDDDLLLLAAQAAL